ncbi:serine hydrolase [Dichotomicrobium thermohalophilum]|uniref:D-alanyl-D-alanine carboxypeptidase n=1 Tax=Dichotomicrobium thermohalophilum TaxID=933063 RepID=A0A397Q8T1_9HYPH|nr:serine hydrolase [Dichotomicrobium thermohalophilum]RIA56235.1 D-alanyl-D-alanine carboxypeptidase [Dichotomicrobium thermohalophilum]
MRQWVSRVERGRWVTSRRLHRSFSNNFSILAMRLSLALVAVCIVFSVPEAGAYSPPKAALVIDANSGKTLHASNARAPRYPASLTKVMTLYVLFEYLRDGRLEMDTRLTVSAHAAKRPPSKVGFRPGDSLTVRAAIRLLVTKSANDVAAVVAENIAGSESAFAQLMTRKAREMGMKDTTFRNASGLPHSEQKTTAYDMSILARRVLTDFPEYADYFKTRYAKYRGKTYRNHNRLLFRYKGIQGLKTGFIRASGFNVMLAAKRGGKRLIAVIMGGRSAGARDARARRLLDAAWKNASVRAPEMAAHLPRRNPVFRPSEREQQIRHKLASADGSPAALLFKHLQASAPAPRDEVRPAPRRKIQARLIAKRTPEPETRTQEASTPEPERARGSATSEGLAGPYHVQVGAYVSANDARRRLEAVSAQAGGLLDGHPHQAIQAEVNGREVFRARFGGFDKAQAWRSCDKLKQRSVDCLVMAAR